MRSAVNAGITAVKALRDPVRCLLMVAIDVQLRVVST